MMRIVSAFLLMAILFATFGPVDVMAAEPASAPIPTFVIKAVQRDMYVTIQTDNLPANDSFNVTMGPFGQRGVNGYAVATQVSADGGRITKTYAIPLAMRSAYKIAIRLESPISGFFAYNWFYNSDANLDLLAEPLPPTPSASSTSSSSVIFSGTPYFYIQAVKKGDTVTINNYNLPSRDTFDVRMNWMGTRGVAGTIVETIDTNKHGQLTESELTFDIPDFLQGSYKIAIRLQSTKSPYYAYNWFYNNNTP
jgi:hypothetical protein